MTSGCLLMQRAAPVEKCLEQCSSRLLVPDDPLPWQAIAFFCSRFDAAGCCRQPAKSLLVLDCSMAAMSKPQARQYFQQICKINFKLRYKKIKKFFLVGVWPLLPVKVLPLTSYIGYWPSLKKFSGNIMILYC